MATRLRYPKGYQFFDGNGNPLALGVLYYYQAGTTTLQTTYSDSAGTVANTNPIVLDGSGRVDVDVYLGSASNYKEVLTTSAATVSPWPDDNIPSAAVAGVFTGDSGSGGSSGLVPAPAAGNAAANMFLSASGAWAVTPAGSGGSATNLGVSETTTTVSISSSTGSGATIPAATTSAAGVMTAAQVGTLNSALQSAPVSSVVGQTGAVTAAQIASALPAATTTAQGVMTAAQVTALNNAASSSALATYAPLASAALIGTPTAPTATTGTNTTQLATTAFVQSAVSGVSGGGTPSSTTPLMDGTAAVGTSTNYARGDHVHPTDTSRAAASALATYAPLASPVLTGTPTAPTATTGTNSTQLATTAFVQSAVSGISGGGTPSSTTPLMDGTAAIGSLTTYARGDHVHPSDTSKVSTSAIGTAAALNVPASGNASSTQVVLGSDTRLSWSDNYTVGSEFCPTIPSRPISAAGPSRAISYGTAAAASIPLPAASSSLRGRTPTQRPERSSITAISSPPLHPALFNSASKTPETSFSSTTKSGQTCQMARMIFIGQAPAPARALRNWSS